MRRFVYNEKYAKLLVKMVDKDYHIDELAKSIEANTGHLRNVLEQWHKEKVITKDRPGREYCIKLTEKGKLLADKFAEIMDIDRNYKPKQSNTNKVVNTITKTNEGKPNESTK